MELKQVIEILRKEKFKHSRSFNGEFMKEWNEDKIEDFYKKNAKIEESLDIAIKCVRNIERFRLVAEDIKYIFEDIE